MYNKIFLLIIIFATPIIVACSNYGKKIEFNKGEVYYKEPVTEAEAKALGEYLVSSGYFDNNPKSVQLLKEGAKYTVNFVVKEGVTDDEETVKTFKIASSQISYDVFDGAIVNIGLTNEYFKTERFIEGFTLGKRLLFGKDQLFYTESIEKDIAEKLGNFLVENGFFKGEGLQAQITQKGETYQFKYVIMQGYEKDNEYHNTVAVFAELISGLVLSGQKVEIHLCNDFFETLKVIPEN